MNTLAILALKRRFKEIFEDEDCVRIVCDKHTYYISKDQDTSYTFDDCGIYAVGKIYASYQASCLFGKVYIPYEAITTLTGADI